MKTQFVLRDLGLFLPFRARQVLFRPREQDTFPPLAVPVPTLTPAENTTISPRVCQRESPAGWPCARENKVQSRGKARSEHHEVRECQALQLIFNSENTVSLTINFFIAI